MSEPLLIRVSALCLSIQEVPGPGSNPVILRWSHDIGAPAFTDDAIAWCALTMNRWCLACEYALSAKRTSYDLLRAKSFLSWGQELSEPALGAVMVFGRPEGAHVGLYLGENAQAFRIRGGNQSNAVTNAWIAKERLLEGGMRWPVGVPLPLTGRVFLDPITGALSSNES